MSNPTTGTDRPDAQALQEWVSDACRGLGLDLPDPENDFFESGGTSLTAIRLISRAEEVFGEDALPPEDLFAHSTVREIAAAIDRNTRS
ncbi:hypothetical protein Kpho02_30620 [Kitasatospora phosalacinea]|uniref:Carrier domain-containing protein n=1 Tax=Kitasatospora phosalacinea TaxID=2065 RepID=A0A9W6Q9C1_9ACTN|nr:acyl carrier protein [Kitasatospora phosalacinea]GLW70763.1 hypothetical protein Kpho02_30620 [Kitasatospora phosalacinea]